MTITYEGATEQTRQVIHHHAVLRRGLERRAGTLCEAVESGVPFEQQLTMLRDYLAVEIFPHALFAGHVAKENDLLLPALTGVGADLAALLADMHDRDGDPASAWRQATG